MEHVLASTWSYACKWFQWSYNVGLEYKLIRSVFFWFRRFWTRNRPGDTILERSEDGILSHASRIEQIHREELEHERASEEMNMPGLDFEGGLLEELQQQGKFADENSKFMFVIFI